MDYPTGKARQSLRLHFISQPGPQFSLKGRTEMLWFDKNGIESQEGFLSYIEFGSQPFKRWKGNVRLQYFETGSYDSRIYAYESDVLYGYSIPAFYEKGFRYYLNASYNASPSLTIWFRIAQTIFTDKASIGSGLDEIMGNRKTEVKLQARLEF
jgi:hypothetical protein